MNKIVEKDKRRKKKLRQPDPRVLEKINEPLKTYHEKKENDFYTTLMQNVEDQRASGQWQQTVRENNRKKILEERRTLESLES